MPNNNNRFSRRKFLQIDGVHGCRGRERHARGARRSCARKAEP